MKKYVLSEQTTRLLNCMEKMQSLYSDVYESLLAIYSSDDVEEMIANRFIVEYGELEKRIETDSEFQLLDPPALMSAKSYKQKFVDPLIKKLKDVIKEVFYRYYHALDSYHRLNNTNANLYRENERLSNINDRLTDENTTLRAENKDFKLLRKVFGSQQIDALIAQSKEQ